MRALSARLAQLLLSWVVLRTTRVAGALVNRTIDDFFGDPFANTHPSYSPIDKWARGDQCTGCNLNPTIIDVSQAFDKTWHDSTYHPGDPDHTITFGFNGTAVYVYHILAGNTSAPVGTTVFTNLTFFIDEQYVGQFVHQPDNTSEIQYDVLVFHQTNLSSDRTHSFTSVTNGPTAALILFDYAVYTTDNDTTTSSSSVPTSTASGTTSSISLAHTSSARPSTSAPIGAIVGGTVGGVVALAGAGALLICLRRRRMVRPPSIAERVEPFTIDVNEPISANPYTRRISHPPRLPDLRFGRSRLIPGTGSSTTGSSSAGSSRHLFTPHRPRLPPPPPQSVSGRTDRSRANTELAQRIQTLEAQMRALEHRQQSGSSGSSRGTGSNPSSNSSRSRGRSTNRSAPSSGLRNELASLRAEIAELRAELEHDQQLLAEVDALPSYDR